jgi:hypothetical protein
MHGLFYAACSFLRACLPLSTQRVRNLSLSRALYVLGSKIQTLHKKFSDIHHKILWCPTG